MGARGPKGWRRLVLAYLLGVMPAAAWAADVLPPANLMLRSADHGHSYAYAPAIIQGRRGDLTMLYCSDPGDSRGWDWLRLSHSRDGRRWTPPEVTLTVSAPERERAACDPSVVRYQAPGDERPYFYLFYSGAPKNVQTAMFVARSSTLEGPYEKWTGTDWQIDAAEPQPILLPVRPRPDGSGFYGAGEQSVVVQGRELLAWHTDDTACQDKPCARVYLSRATHPGRWSRPVATNVEGLGSVDVKYDAERRLYVMYGIAAAHSEGSTLVRRVSADGLSWEKEEVLGAPGAFPRWSHNVGVSGDAQGHLVGPDLLVIFGAPDPGNPACGSCWGRWNLYGFWIAR